MKISLFIYLLLIVLPCFIYSLPFPGVEWRSYTGEGNNYFYPKLGMVGTPIVRLAKQSYKINPNNNYSNDFNLPIARSISNIVCDQESDMPSAAGFTQLFNIFGQFITHSLIISSFNVNIKYGVKIPACDKFFDPKCTGNQTLLFTRSQFLEVACGENYVKNEDGKCFENVNGLSSYIDGNIIYGSSKDTADKLRTFSNGELNMTTTSVGLLLPKGIDGIFIINDANIVPTKQLFSTGEPRGNENFILATLETLFARDHNRNAKIFKSKHSDWSDEDIFQSSRSCVVAQIQKILNEEYLPIVLGKSWKTSYPGYSAFSSPLVYSEFSTSAFRFAHSTISSRYNLRSANGTIIEVVPTRNAFSNPKPIDNNGIEPILKGIFTDLEQEMDSLVVNDVRNFLFGAPGQGGFDLLVRDLQRNREHAMGSYNTVRLSIGLKAAKKWSDITSNRNVQLRLQMAYGDIDKVDLFIGGLAEDRFKDSYIGETFATIIQLQFTKTKKSDRFWYQNPIQEIVNRECNLVSFSELIKRNTNPSIIGAVPDNVFINKGSIKY